MPSTNADFALLRDAFSSAAMRPVFGDDGRLQRYLDFESALARVQARLGLIPEAAAVEIDRQLHP
jgi:3-carboxy-cis,cis-muconate cycloisomerase